MLDREVGVEPTTAEFKARCYLQLSYSRMPMRGIEPRCEHFQCPVLTTSTTSANTPGGNRTHSNGL